MNNSVFLYADDSKIYNTIDKIEDCKHLQDSLDSLNSWCTVWGFKFNAEKCKVMSFTSCRTKYEYLYKINDMVLERVNTFNDLGIMVQDNLKWDQHTSQCVKKANIRLGLLKRNLDSNCSKEVKLLCYKALVRPILEYGSTIWSDNSKKQLKLIEGIQRRATTYVINDINIGYKERLLICNLLPLSYRREYLDAIFLYNNIQGLNICNMTKYIKFNTANVNTRLAGEDWYILPNRMCSKNYEQFFINRIRYIWNNLSLDIRCTELTDAGKNTSFKTVVKQHFLSMLNNKFDVNDTCSWITHCYCSRCNPF
jgi:hypothetical protein